MSTFAVQPSAIQRSAIQPSAVRPSTYRPRPAVRRADRASQVRLTRRGRAVLFLVALTTVLVVGFFWGAGSVATQERGSSPATEIVMVQPGETLWDIASRLTPAGDDVRETMYDIKRLNTMVGSALDAGQRIRVPSHD